MDNTASLIQNINDSLAAVAGQFIAYFPRILAAVALLVVGWIVARLLKSMVIRIISGLDVFWQKLVSRKGIGQLQSRQPPARFVGELVFWLLILVIIALVSEILGLGVFVSWLSEIVRYLPILLSGMLVVLAGFIVSSLARDITTSAMSTAGLGQGELIGRSVQVIILFTAIVIGVDQVGIDITFLSVMASVILAATLGGVAIAFGIGARTHVANLVAAHHIKETLQPGDQVRICDVTGVITEITSTRIIMESEEGRHILPAAIINENTITYLDGD
jgi:hypothetical protein